MADMIHDYLDQFRAALPPDMEQKQRARLLCEIEGHLLESWEAEQGRAMPEQEAQRLVLERFGSPIALAQEFAQLDASRKLRMVRLCLFAGLIAFLFVVVSSLFRYPTVSGPPVMPAVDSLLCGGIVCLYWWTGIRGTHFATPVEATGPWRGTKAGLIFGTLLTGTSIVSTLLTSLLWGAGGSLFPRHLLISLDHEISACSTGAALLAWLGLTTWYSVSAAYETRRIDISVKAGFWSGLVGSLAMALIGLLEYYLFLNLTLHTSWSHDSTCLGSPNLAGCEMNDLLGGIATIVLLLPFIGAVLGVFAGFVVRKSWLAAQYSLQTRKMSPAASRQETRIGFPLICCGITLALFLVGTFTNLW